MTWTRNSHSEFVRVARTPRANLDRDSRPAFGPVSTTWMCTTCGCRFSIKPSGKSRRLCGLCRLDASMKRWRGTEAHRTELGQPS
jgi:hypothetical protein